MAVSIYSVFLPENVEAGAVFRLSDSTERNEGDDGTIDPTRRFIHGKQEWQLVFSSVTDPDDIEDVEAMFDVLGQEGGFLFWPPLQRHRYATAQVLPQVGTTDDYQLRVTTSIGGGTTDIYRDILYPRTDGAYAPVIKVDGVVAGGGYTIEDVGIVSFASDQGAAVITADFYYYTPCVFISDSFDSTLVTSTRGNSETVSTIIEQVRSISIAEVWVNGAA